MYGLSLFSGYGGIDLALSDYVRPLMYCDIEKYAQGIILSRMDDGHLPFAPIWNDVTTMDGKKLRGLVDIIYGGFPCQDLSVAGKGAGLAGKRSGLFTEIIRIAQEASPTFIFLENVPAIRTRGSLQVQEALASIGYDTRWCTLSASEVGANHKRERWFCLAYSKSSHDRICFSRESNGKVQQSGECTEQTDISNTHSTELRHESGRINRTHRQGTPVSGHNGTQESVADSISTRRNGNERNRHHPGEDLSGKAMAQGSATECSDDSRVSGKVSHTNVQGQCREATTRKEEDHKRIREDYWWTETSATHSDWWAVEPRVGRVANGVKNRAHRIKALGNGVVPLQVKTAFEILMGIK
jgi:DNA (cytosine-5)-methyltransferase 1